MELNETYYDEDEIEIDLVELFYVMKRKLVFIILFFLIGSGIAFSATYFGIKPTYQSTAKIYVVSASKNSVLDLTGLNMGSSLAADYEQLILSDTVLNNVIKKLDLDMDAKELAGKIELNNPADTRILEITVTTTDAVLSKDIANKVVDVSLKYLPKTMSANPPNIAQRAKLMPEKTGPGYVKNTVIGGMAAAFLYCAYLVIRFLMDDTIKTPEDMEKYFGILPLTTIPEGKKIK